VTVLYVDVEHDRVVRDPARAPSHREKIAAALRRLEALAGEPCAVLRVAEISPRRVAQVAPAAIVLSGATTDWEEYDLESLETLLRVVRAAPVPILGICAGHQLVGRAHGAKWGPLAPLQPGEADPDPRFAPGRRKERGFLDVELDPSCPIFRGLGPSAKVFQSHYWQLEEVPDGFALRASSPWSRVQAIERLDRPVFGVQFHPERADAAHPAGDLVLRNFFGLVSRRSEGAAGASQDRR
jgi:GMP synthase-like glutamine amidotransferase